MNIDKIKMVKPNNSKMVDTIKKDSWDIFRTISQDSSDTGILDDIRDLRRYLLLVESFTNEEDPTELLFPNQPEFPSTRKEN